MEAHVPWYRSVAVKSCAIAFVATHIPLLGLVALVVLRPDWLSPWRVFFIALALTLFATALVVTMLWRMFSPLRAAADGLLMYMTRGRMVREIATGSDDIGRLVQVLVRALAHLDRSRSALLEGSAMAVADAVRESAPESGGDARHWLVLLEMDGWAALDGQASITTMINHHRAVADALDSLLVPGESGLPWGRGRFLVWLSGSGSDVRERLAAFCRDQRLTAVMDAQRVGAAPNAAALQRLDQKLFQVRTGMVPAAA